jgi:hypothetical protein
VRARTAESIAPDEAIGLSHLQNTWSAAYAVRFEDGKYRASFHYDDTELEADTLAGIDSVLRAHWHRTWSSRSDAWPEFTHWSAE